MIFPGDNWKQRAVDQAQRDRMGYTTIRISRATRALLERVRGSIDATDDETIFYLAVAEIRAQVASRAPARPVNASDADRPLLPSERAGS